MIKAAPRFEAARAVESAASNGSKGRDATDAPQAAATAKKRDANGVQRAVLGSLKDQDVSLTLLSGETIRGTLRAADTFSLAVQIDGEQAARLYYKHGVSSVRAAP